MTALATRPHYDITPEQMIEMPDTKHAELVNGRLLEKPGISAESGYITIQLSRRLGNYAAESQDGAVFDDQASYQCFPHAPHQVRKPDISFIRRERLTPAMRRGHVRIVPDLAVEVVSPNDRAWHIEGRINDFLRAGTPLVWVLYPDLKVAVIYIGGGGEGGRVMRLRGDGELDGGEVLPGFRCAIEELFALPEEMRGEEVEQGGEA